MKVNKGWSIFPYFFEIHKVFLFGDEHFNIIYNRCNNILWKDVISSCKVLYDSIWLTKYTNFKDMSIWYNSRVCNYFNREWFEKGFLFIKDLFINEKLVSLENICNFKGLKCNFLEYEFVKKKIALLNILVYRYTRTLLTILIMLEKI